MRGELHARGVRPERVSVVGNGVDSDWFSPQPRSEALASKLGLNGGCIVGFLGSFYHYEGLPSLVEALPALRERVPGTRLLLVGKGEDDGRLREMARGLGDAVILPGAVPFEQVREFYSVIDIFACPRRRMRLTELVTPLKPLEAMAMGRAVLASDVGGQAELIRHNDTGVLFPAESTSGLVDAAARLAAARDERARLGERAREFILAERGWREVVARYLPIYRAARGAKPA
jgi:glycosyltransferase involved in cell wall biosynthesis